MLEKIDLDKISYTESFPALDWQILDLMYSVYNDHITASYARRSSLCSIYFVSVACSAMADAFASPKLLFSPCLPFCSRQINQLWCSALY